MFFCCYSVQLPEKEKHKRISHRISPLLFLTVVSHKGLMKNNKLMNPLINLKPEAETSATQRLVKSKTCLEGVHAESVIGSSSASQSAARDKVTAGRVPVALET